MVFAAEHVGLSGPFGFLVFLAAVLSVPGAFDFVAEHAELPGAFDFAAAVITVSGAFDFDFDFVAEHFELPGVFGFVAAALLVPGAFVFEAEQVELSGALGCVAAVTFGITEVSGFVANGISAYNLPASLQVHRPSVLVEASWLAELWQAGLQGTD